MRKRVRGSAWWLVPVLTVPLFAVACGDGQQAAVPERTVAELSGLSGTERQSALEEGAESEGTLSVATVIPGLEDLVSAFEEQYPFVTVEVFETRASALIERILAEKQAGSLSTDVILASDADLGPMQEEDVLVDFDAPGAQFVGDLKATIVSGDAVVFGYSTERVSPDEVPQVLEDLLDPRLRGRLGLYGPPNFLAPGWTGMLINELGEEEAIRLLEGLSPQVALFNESAGTASIQQILRGEIDIGQMTFSDFNLTKEEVGEDLPMDFVPLDYTYAFTNRAAIVGGAPHPHAALLFVDFLLSGEGQAQVTDIPAAQFETLELAGKSLTNVYFEDADDAPFYDQWEQLFSDVVVRGREVVPEEE